MELFLQFGYGMKALTLDLAKQWGRCSVILSPRDMSIKQLRNWAKEFEGAYVKTYLDPQCYCPGGVLKNLSEYGYLVSDLGDVLEHGGSSLDKTLFQIKQYNDWMGTEAYILPAILYDYDSSWEDKFVRQEKNVVKSARELMKEKPLLVTLALPKSFLEQREEAIESVLQEFLNLETDGYYIVAETPDKKYLVDNPIWLSNILHICATLKIAGKKVIFGYGNHQMLPLALIQIDAMASGSWLNVRSFTNRFLPVDEQKRRVVWVYYPEAFSEYKMPFLDWAYNYGVLNSMHSKDKAFLDEGIKKIFNGKNAPSVSGFTEPDAFKHYLCCLKHQVELLDKASYKEAFGAYELMLITAEREIERLEKAGMYGQGRSFKDFIDVNRAAINQLDKGHGFPLAMSWGKE